MYPHRCSNVRLYRHPFGVGTLFLMILAICRRSDAWITTRPVRIATLRNSVTVGRDRSVVTALFLTASSTETFDRTTGRQLVQEGMQVFRAGNVQQSIELFDLAEQKEGPSLTPYLWQRGLSYYYDDNFAAASRQFRTDVSVNPADVEEIVWDIASQLRIDATEFPIPNQLSLLVGTTDRRRIMVRDHSWRNMLPPLSS